MRDHKNGTPLGKVQVLQEPFDMERAEQSPRDPAPEAEWEVWYQDTFDRECPPSVDVSGRGLTRGLMELWARHLFETVRPGGSRGFSRFHLWWKGTHVDIHGDWEGATRLREWVFGAKKHSRKGYVEEGNTRLLEMIAVAHANLILANQPSEQILAAAAAAKDRQDFEARLRERI
jgi:hypothetical protein